MSAELYYPPGRDVEDFLDALHHGGYRYMAGFREGKQSQTHNFRHDAMVHMWEFAETYYDLNVYFGVAQRADAIGHGGNHCVALGGLFVDVDFNKTPQLEALAKLNAFPLRPSAVVGSGNGLHVYWLLKQPFNLQKGTLPQAKAMLRALAEAIGGDLNSAEPARILRLPDTLNYKYDPPRPVGLRYLNERRYTIAEMRAALPLLQETPLELPKEPVAHGFSVDTRIRQAKAWLAHQAPAITGEEGDPATYKICCSVVRGHDLSQDDAFKALAEWNARCKPPWPEDELRQKIHNADMYAKGQCGEMLPARSLTVKWASDIKPKPVQWLWQGRLPLSELCLLAGREGIGKTTAAYNLVADITRGCLPGRYFGTPRVNIIAATEDSWEHTIVPRLMAANADLGKVARVNVEVQKIGKVELSLPDDIMSLEQLVVELDAALVLLDPVIPRLSKKLDTHKDADVRLALEPTARIAHTTGACVLGIIHVNKGTSRDPLNTIMGSRAFVAASRAVLFVVQDPNDEKVRLLGQAKNNLGRSNLPSLTFTIEEATVAQSDEGPIKTGKLRWLGESPRSIRDLVEEAADGGADRGQTAEAMDWLRDYMNALPLGWGYSKVIKAAAKKDGHRERTLERAKKRLGLVVHSGGFPRKTVWALPNAIVPEQLPIDEGGV